ncbi:hypothetical protein [Xanthovirga aplysinae]|uniref:hypothetical protein n=1 Tax=Xanthovirga aplysinae TaxID=2529853 RepID=UPI0012BB4A7E|nr:hypothetical protein [Xanthovirga aplysinae]MTI30102.1 hypothetical protein [Xanthovirga aplysinae]
MKRFFRFNKVKDYSTILKVFVFLSFSVLRVFAYQELKAESYSDIIIENTLESASTDVEIYIDQVYTHYKDTLDAQSGFFGLNNLKDYISFGEESMKEKSSRFWMAVYDSTTVKKMAYKHLEEAYIALDKDPAQIKLEITSGNDQIAIYAHKIALSLPILIVEEFFELLLSIFFGSSFLSIVVSVYVFYQFSFGPWINWSKKRREKVDNLGKKAQRWGIRLGFIIFLLISWYTGDLTEKGIKYKITNTLTKEISEQVKKNLIQ